MDKYLDLYLQSFPKCYILVCILRLKQTGSHVRPSHLPPSANGHVPAIILSWAFGFGRSWAFGTIKLCPIQAQVRAPNNSNADSFNFSAYVLWNVLQVQNQDCLLRLFLSA